MITVQPDAGGLAQAAEAIRAGEVVAYPTETVYGLAVDPFNEQAIKRLFEVKGRPETNPILLIVADESQLVRVVQSVPTHARPYMAHFWPGPLSLLFPAAPDLPHAVTAGKPKVCVRCPGAETPRALCAAFGAALTSTSANRSGAPPAVDAQAAALPGVSVVVDGGALAPASPSTVFDSETHVVLRHGAISARELADFANR